MTFKLQFYSPISSLIFCAGFIMLTYVKKMQKQLLKETISIGLSNFKTTLSTASSKFTCPFNSS